MTGRAGRILSSDMMTALISGLFFLLGAVLGSFANVCIWRLPRGESIIWPPSHCPRCQKKLSPWQMVPILSWLLLKGKCGHCGGRISLRYPLVETTTAVIFAAIGYTWGPSVLSLQYCILSLALIISVATDFSHREIPDQVSLGAAAVLALIALPLAQWGNLLGGIMLFGILFLIAVLSKGGMGGGDIKLVLAIGLSLGWQLGLLALALAVFAGGVLAIFMLLMGQRKKALPFAPFLAIGAWLAMFFGHRLLDLYISVVFMLGTW